MLRAANVSAVSRVLHTQSMQAYTHSVCMCVHSGTSVHELPMMLVISQVGQEPNQAHCLGSMLI